MIRSFSLFVDYEPITFEEDVQSKKQEILWMKKAMHQKIAKHLGTGVLTKRGKDNWSKVEYEAKKKPKKKWKDAQ